MCIQCNSQSNSCLNLDTCFLVHTSFFVCLRVDFCLDYFLVKEIEKDLSSYILGYLLVNGMDKYFISCVTDIPEGIFSVSCQQSESDQQMDCCFVDA